MRKEVLVLIGGLFLGASIAYGVWYPDTVSEYLVNSKYCDTPLATPAILAKSAYAFDEASGDILYEKNPNAQLPLASLTKIMTVLTSHDTLSGTTTVKITKDALAVDGEYGFKDGEMWTAKDLTDFTLIASANDGARALMLATVDALHITPEDFYKAMNRKAAALHLSSMFFINETGLDVSPTTAGAYGNARDVAHLIAAAEQSDPEAFNGTSHAGDTLVSLSGVKHSIENTSMLAAALMSSHASKTGYTDLAGGNLALVFEPLAGHPVAIAVMGSTRDGRNSDAEVIAKTAGEALKHLIACRARL